MRLSEFVIVEAMGLSITMLSLGIIPTELFWTGIVGLAIGILLVVYGLNKVDENKRKKIDWAKKRKDLERPIKAMDDMRWVVLYYFNFFMMIFLECFGLYGIINSILLFPYNHFISAIGTLFFAVVIYVAFVFYEMLCSMLKKENKKYWRY